MRMDRHKRELRKLKREIKRAGSKHRRRELRRELIDNPDEAHHSEQSFGRNRSAGLNGLDNPRESQE
jgi:hypothetical protein